MATLNPAPEDLGLASPALGPWFGPSEGALPTLGAPQADLSVSLSFAADVQWQAPANGVVSYFVASTTRPGPLARMRAENGGPAFSNDRGVILFTLLPETELRLHALARSIPLPDGAEGPGDQPTRPRVRWLAFEVPFASLTALGQMLSNPFPPDLTTDDQKADYLGLTFDGSTFGNGERPVTILKRPTADAVILKNGTGDVLSGSLWAFDYRGRPVDPGAVAAWWRYLASVEFDNLWALEDTDEQRTAAYDASHTVHLVSAHEGPLPDKHNARLDVSDLTKANGSHAFFTRSGDAPVVSLTSPPDPDDAPIPRLALLPHGTYDDPATVGGSVLSGWVDDDWPVELERDFARLALVDVEQHLVGRDRTDDAQKDERTRIHALRNTAPTPFFTRVDDATAELMSVLRDGAEAVVMAPVMDEDWGALTPGDFGTGQPPERLAYEVRALRGEGAESSGVVTGQEVVVIFENTSDPLPEKAWVRVWPHGIDAETGFRAPLDGGGGRVDATGQAYVRVPLPDGAASPPTQMSFDVLVQAGNTIRLYVEQRFDRPAVVAGDRVDLPPPPGSPPGFSIRICETGEVLERGVGAYGSGQTLLAIPDNPTTGEFALVDLSTLNDSDYDEDSLRRSAGSGDSLMITAPAYKNTPEGDLEDPAPGGAALVRRGRDGLQDTITQMGRPVPTMERREVAAVDETLTRGVVAGTPGRAAWHEAPPAQFGHAGVPAAPEVHGAGAMLQGPAAVPLVRLMRERRASNLLEFVQAVQIAPAMPADPGGPSGWAAVLETITRGVVGDAAIRNFAASDFTPGQSWLDLKEDIENATGEDLDSVINSDTFNDEDLAHALDGMIGKTKDGAMQVAPSIQAAIERAEDFIYLETPCLDALSAASDAVAVVDKITARLTERSGLVVLIGCSELFLPDQPRRLQEVRRAAISGALKVLNDAASERVALFVPTAGPDRRLHMATTTVIVDDAYVLVGATHLWRRGLTFDSSLAVAAFDERISEGRPAAIRSLRTRLVAERLGLLVEMTPDDPQEVVFAVKKLIEAGGLGRINPNAFPAREDTTGTSTQDAWNPDGSIHGASDWFLFFTSLAGGEDDVSNVVR